MTARRFLVALPIAAGVAGGAALAGHGALAVLAALLASAIATALLDHLLRRDRP